MHYRFTLKVLIGILFVALASAHAVAQDKVEGVRAKEYSLDSDKLKYFLIGSSEKQKAPEKGYKLLVVMPGGDGSADFKPFVQNIYKHALDENYLVVELIAPKWSDNQEIVWPTAKLKANGQKTPVEDFVARAVEDVGKRTRVDSRHIYTLSWSSGGPAAYATSLRKNTPVTGSLVAMSVFYPQWLPDLKAAKGKPYYILHSKEDQVCAFFLAELARDRLREAGATVEFTEYEGGHGWHGDVFGNIRKGIEWLEGQAGKNDAIK